MNNHGGKLPLLIKAVPEGEVVPFKNGNCNFTLYYVLYFCIIYFQCYLLLKILILTASG